jgi:hypothetical protein
VPFKIKINCLSKEFDELDEYVYSMRRPTTQDVFNYNDTFLILLAQKAISYYKLAIKVPNIMEEKEILGNIEISCNECKNGVIKIPIKSTIGRLLWLRDCGVLWLYFYGVNSWFFLGGFFNIFCLFLLCVYHLNIKSKFFQKLNVKK